MTEAAEKLPAAANYSVLVEETTDGISFLHTVVPRPADKSYGIQVAKLAGVPENVIQRAQVLLRAREASMVSSERPSGLGILQEEQSLAVKETAVALDDFLFQAPYQRVAEELAEVDVMRLTPLEALNVLNRLVESAKEARANGTNRSDVGCACKPNRRR